MDSLALKNNAPKDFSLVNKDLRNQVVFQNETIIQLQKQISELALKNKEFSTNSWVNDQKLSEIMVLLKQKSQSCSQYKEPTAQSPLKDKKVETPVVVQKEEKPVIYKQERLSVKANLPADYESPKVKYKNDELK